MKKIKILQFDDWEVLMNDGVILLQNHSLTTSEVLKALNIEFDYEYIENSDIDSYIHEIFKK